MASPNDPNDVLSEGSDFDWDKAAQDLMAEESAPQPPPVGGVATSAEAAKANDVIVIHLAALSGGPPDFSGQMCPTRGSAKGGMVPSQPDSQPAWAQDDGQDDSATADLAAGTAPSAPQVPDTPVEDDEPQPFILGGSDDDAPQDTASSRGQDDLLDDDPVARIRDRAARPISAPYAKPAADPTSEQDRQHEQFMADIVSDATAQSDVADVADVAPERPVASDVDVQAAGADTAESAPLFEPPDDPAEELSESISVLDELGDLDMPATSDSSDEVADDEPEEPTPSRPPLGGYDAEAARGLHDLNFDDL